MRLNKAAKCGTLESNDILESTVEKQFGAHMREVIKNKLVELGVEGVKVQAQDKGALDFTIRARIEAAVARAL